jgi:hypothetical protein
MDAILKKSYKNFIHNSIGNEIFGKLTEITQICKSKEVSRKIIFIFRAKLRSPLAKSEKKWKKITKKS